MTKITVTCGLTLHTLYHDGQFYQYRPLLEETCQMDGEGTVKTCVKHLVRS